MSDSTARIFNVGDSTVLSSATLFASLCESEFHLFTAFSPAVFSPKYIPDFRNEIDAAYSEYGDSQVRSEMSEDTQAVIDQMNVCKTYFGKLRFYIEIAFDDEPKKLKLFGVGSFSKEVTGVDSMMLFMSRFNTAVDHHKKEITAVGCSETLIEETVTATEILRRLRDEQQRSKMTRADLARRRVTLLNSIWKKMSIISRGAREIHTENPELAARYALPYPTKGEKEDAVTLDDLMEHTHVEGETGE